MFKEILVSKVHVEELRFSVVKVYSVVVLSFKRLSLIYLLIIQSELPSNYIKLEHGIILNSLNMLMELKSLTISQQLPLSKLVEHQQLETKSIITIKHFIIQLVMLQSL